MHAQEQTQERMCADAVAQAQGAGSQVQSQSKQAPNTQVGRLSAQKAHSTEYSAAAAVYSCSPLLPPADGDLQRLLARPHAEGDNLFREDIFNKK